MKKILIISLFFTLFSGCITNFEGLTLSPEHLETHDRVLGKYVFIEHKDGDQEIINLEIKKYDRRNYILRPTDPEHEKEEGGLALSFIKPDQRLLAIFRELKDNTMSGYGVVCLFEDRGDSIAFSMLESDKVLEYNNKYPGRLTGEINAPQFGSPEFILKGSEAQFLKSLSYISREPDLFQEKPGMVFQRVKK